MVRKKKPPPFPPEALPSPGTDREVAGDRRLPPAAAPAAAPGGVCVVLPLPADPPLARPGPPPLDPATEAVVARASSCAPQVAQRNDDKLDDVACHTRAR
jgi:hypothetical protein